MISSSIRRTWVGVGVVVVLLGSCNIPSDSAPRDIAEANRVPLGGAAAPSVGANAGNDRVYLIAPDVTGAARHLRSSQRTIGASASLHLDSLFGPLSIEESSARLRTAIPEGQQLNSARLQANGTLVVDISDDILALPSNALIDAVAQIVFTAFEVDNVKRVRILVTGVGQQWPGGDGALRTAPLTVFDFQGFIETTQPDFPAVPSPGQ